MDSNILEIKNLTKQYGRNYAIDNISISLKQGHIYGFIGANGAGKTTLLRIISGLSYPNSGDIIFDKVIGIRNLERIRKYIGSTIEEPVLYPNYSVTENLELQRILSGNPDKNVLNELLELVGLSDAKNKKARNLSTGMKQRLGIALCLIGQPKLLLLDEPVNGLDPKGISDLRKILIKLNTEKKITILISSHILSELHLLATDYIIIHNGKILKTITADELETRCRKFISIRMDNIPMGLTVIEKELHSKDYKILENGMVYLYNQNKNINIVADILHRNNILVTHLALSEETLEEYYLEVTGGKNHD